MKHDVGILSKGFAGLLGYLIDMKLDAYKYKDNKLGIEILGSK